MENDKSYILDECPFMPGMGTINASGVLKNLNGSKLSLTEIFLRETVQNSFDARIKSKEQKPLLFNMRAFHFNDEQFKKLLDLLGGNNNPFSYYSKNVKKYLSKDMLNIEVSDLNTTGLIGNYEPTEKVGGQNFTNFVYFTGNDKQKDETSGGSYGFGKAALFAYSKARIIVVYTRIYTSDYQSRFIVISSDERIEDSNSDRCWWGKKTSFSIKDRGTYAAPILGSDADALAQAIGMIPFNEDETGTRILVVNAGPEEDQLPEDEYGNKKTIDNIFKDDLPKYIVHWYWNSILSSNNKIQFSLSYENEKINIDDPQTVIPYKQFASAYRFYLQNIKNGRLVENKNFKIIKKDRPQVTLGYFTFVNTPIMSVAYKDIIEIFKTSEPVVAFMRGIGHIVYYDRIPLNNESIENTCYGIVKTDIKAAPNGEKEGAIDKYFRKVENQTHDKWEHQKEKHGRHNYVKTVEETISDIVRNQFINDTEEQKSSDISIVIQRTLGEKLMPYLSSIGGAKAPLKDVIERKEKARKCTITSTGVTKIEIDRNIKYVYAEYKANVIEGKKIRINGAEPIVRTMDSADGAIFDSDILVFKSIAIPVAEGSVRQFVQKAFELGTCIIDVSKIFYVKIECKEDCAYDVKIDWEEIDA